MGQPKTSAHARYAYQTTRNGTEDFLEGLGADNLALHSPTVRRFLHKVVKNLPGSARIDLVEALQEVGWRKRTGV